MKKTYNIKGMTCNGCVASVEEKISNIDGVKSVKANLEKGELEIDSEKLFSVTALKNVLPDKYAITEKESIHTETISFTEQKSKWQQLKPLFLILFYIAVASNLMEYKNWEFKNVMLNYMGLFYIVFSFFKFLDLKGFPDSFKMYDPIAKRIGVYGWVYPFIETALGLLFLFRVEIPLALVVTLVILGATTYGVVKTLLDKKAIKCACLGTALNLPMTEATFIENTIMIMMALTMLFI
ncbi:heavy metal transporter [Wenyingzhuangia fucanilytica]|uniref:Heavy metal transporter n=1 Tax=Wenyingzhuangia fucanilytica TaxID=1790137 RepID=A0A1B1Y475_9FLAO|nr:heavy-metal-associated domain-containing protein [Wenyingzhuangia fucanilytica]ANW95572.1 heavy metal transporter [Wenyingzhuangia fucanilytica]